MLESCDLCPALDRLTDQLYVEPLCLQHANELLRSIVGRGGAGSGAATLSCGRTHGMQFGRRISLGMQPVSISGRDDQHVCRFTLHWAGVHDFSWRSGLVADAANVA